MARRCVDVEPIDPGRNFGYRWRLVMWNTDGTREVDWTGTKIGARWKARRWLRPCRRKGFTVVDRG